MNCATAGVTPYVATPAMPWSRERAVHLHRRMMFGAGAAAIAAALAADPIDVVNAEIDRALALPLMPEPEFADRTQAQYGLALLQSVLEKDGWARDWILTMQAGGLRERMSLFWHNHFVTRFDAYESSSYTYQYHKLLQEYALGDFRTFVRRMGLTPAMLVFLNGSENVAGNPNENYARELYELFTLGDGNGYTQTDIEETARALTGYTNVTEPWGPILFDPATHDSGQKTIFGRTGNWGYDDVIDILFEERAQQIATFIAGKLYRHFVNPEPDENAIAGYATVFLDGGWNVAELLRAIFTSAHFFDKANISTIILGPLEHTLVTYSELGIALNGLSVFGVWSGAAEQGQVIFQPVDVAGWPGNRSWINTTSIATRWRTIEESLGGRLVFGFNELAAVARSITAEQTDVEVICRDLTHHFLPRGFQFERDYEEALANFQGDIPPQYFRNGIWTIDYWALPIQLYNLLRFINRIPEYQLK